MGYTGDLIDGIAQLLQLAGVGVYRPNGPAYASTDTGITVSTLPDAPNRLICLTPYMVDDSDLTDALVGVQVRMRAGVNPLDLLALADAVFGQLHNRRNSVFGETSVALIWRQSEAPMGQDAHGRDERTANYYAQVTRTGAHLYE